MLQFPVTTAKGINDVTVLEKADLAVIGAGPKGIATALRAKLSAEVGRPPRSVVLIDRLGPGANWTAAGGWTDGRHRLGTSPEKDVGFPYDSADPEVDRAVQAYSWNSYLAATGRLGEWIDRGRPSPVHRQWHDYLSWVVDRAGLTVLWAEVKEADVVGGEWSLKLSSVEGGSKLVARSLMVTGPGPGGTTLPDASGQVIGPAGFWRIAAMGRERKFHRVLVVGGGETAGAVIDQLLRMDVDHVELVTPSPVAFSRGENYLENAVYTHPGEWAAWPIEVRRDLIRRTDRGVISQRVQQRIAEDDRVTHHGGRVTGFAAGPGGSVLAGVTAAAGPMTVTCDLAIDACGAQPLWFLDLFTPAARDIVRHCLPRDSDISARSVEDHIGDGLELLGARPRLVLPMLSGVAQGPGFPNLSCLGAMADRVLTGMAVDENVGKQSLVHHIFEV